MLVGDLCATKLCEVHSCTAPTHMPFLLIAFNVACPFVLFISFLMFDFSFFFFFVSFIRACPQQPTHIHTTPTPPNATTRKPRRP